MPNSLFDQTTKTWELRAESYNSLPIPKGSLEEHCFAVILSIRSTVSARTSDQDQIKNNNYC